MPADSLYKEQVVIDADTVGAERGFDRVQSRASAFERAVQGLKGITVSLVDRATGPLAGIQRALASVGRGVTLGIGLGIAGQIMGVIGSAKDAIIGMNAELETSTFQFTTLMGDAEQAKKHVMDLFEFAKKTPFESGPVIAASRTLRTFGGASLDTMENLTTLGDAAAATQNDIKEVAFWAARMHNSMAAGASFGEEIRRMQEMALLGPEVSQKLMDLSKSGKATAADFNMVLKEFGRFSGAMDKMQFTWAGVTSTFNDTIRILAATAFKPLFELLRDSLHGLNDVLGSEGVSAVIESFAAGLAGALTFIGNSIGRVLPIIGGLYTGITALGAAFTVDPGAIGIFATLINDAFGPGAVDAVRPFLVVGMHLASVVRAIAQSAQMLLSGKLDLGTFLHRGLTNLGNVGREAVAGLVRSVTTEIRNHAFEVAESATLWIYAMARRIGVGGPVSAALSWLWTAWPKVRAGALTVFGWLTGTALPAVGDRARAAIGFLATTWTAIRSAAGTALTWVFGTALPAILDAGHRALDWLIGAWPTINAAAHDALDWLSGAWDTFGSLAHDVLDWLEGPAWTAIDGAVHAAMDWVTGPAWTTLSAAAAPVLDWLRGPAWTAISDAATGALAWVTTAAWPWLQHEAGGALDWLQTTPLWGAIKSAAFAALEWVTGPAWETLKGVAIGAWTTLNATVFPLIESFGAWLLEKAGGAVQTFVQPGGLWDQMKEKGAGAMAAITGAAAAPQPFTWLLDPRLPVAATNFSKGLDALTESIDNLQKIIGPSTGHNPVDEYLHKMIDAMPDVAAHGVLMMSQAFRALAEGIRDLTGAIVAIKAVGFPSWLLGPVAEPSALPAIGIPEVGPPVPPGLMPGGTGPGGMPGAASGAVVTRPTALWVGEGGETEAVLPLRYLRTMLGTGGGQGGGRTIQVNVNDGAVRAEIRGEDSGDVMSLVRRIGEPLAGYLAEQLQAHEAARSTGALP